MYHCASVAALLASASEHKSSALVSSAMLSSQHIAPEVGHTKFRPMRADLWSVGKVIQELCMLCRPSPARDWLLSVSKQLLNKDPNKRPMMSEVLQRMPKFDAIEIPHYGHSSIFL